MSNPDHDDFTFRLQGALHRAGSSVTATPELDNQFDRRIARRRRRAPMATAAVTGALLLGAAVVTVAVSSHSQPAHVSVAPAQQDTSIPSTPQVYTPPGWALLPPAPTASRIDEVAVWTGSEVLFWGGQTVKGATGPGVTYNPSTRHWSLPATAPISPRDGPVAVWTGTEALIYGGSLGDSSPDNGAAYDPATNTWRQLPAAPLGNLTDSASYAAWTGSEMLAWGFFGNGSSGNHGGGSDAVGIFDPATDHWRTGAVAPVQAPVFGQAVWTGSEFIIVGAGEGSASTDTVPEITVAYNPATNTWRRLPPSPLPGGRDQTLAVWDGTELIVGGGFGGGPVPGQEPHDDVAAYNPTTNTWRVLPDAPQGFTGEESDYDPDIWDGHDVVILEDSDPHGRPLLLDPATGTWHFGPPAPTPAVSDTPAVWTGQTILRWGGATAHEIQTGASCLCDAVPIGTSFTPNNA